MLVIDVVDPIFLNLLWYDNSFGRVCMYACKNLLAPLSKDHTNSNVLEYEYKWMVLIRTILEMYLINI